MEGLESFKEAILRNPETTLRAIKQFLTRGIAVYNRILIRNPWRVGMSGGGIPVRQSRYKGRKIGGNLRDTHQREIEQFEARIYPTAPYAGYVHDGTRKMKARPWLDYAQETGEREIDDLGDEMVGVIAEDLAR